MAIDTAAIDLADDDEVPSPCISICKMNAGCGTSQERAAGGLCTGCLRTLEEIIEWGRATPARKRAIWSSIASRKADGDRGTSPPKSFP